jgi:hypothetical protein
MLRRFWLGVFLTGVSLFAHADMYWALNPGQSHQQCFYGTGNNQTNAHFNRWLSYQIQVRFPADETSIAVPQDPSYEILGPNSYAVGTRIMMNCYIIRRNLRATPAALTDN